MFYAADEVYQDFSDMIDDIYGDTNPDCPGHEIADGENSRVIWCDFSEDCPES